MALIVAKVGGSLFDLPDLNLRLHRWLSGVDKALFVPGGGAAVDAIRELHRIHPIDDAVAHFLALRVMTANAEFLAALLGGNVVRQPADASMRLSVLDAYGFCAMDPGGLEQSWRVTSDSIAARVAEIAAADLVLLKSIDLPKAMSWKAAADASLVDEAFPAIVQRAGLKVTWVNLRTPL